MDERFSRSWVQAMTCVLLCGCGHVTEPWSGNRSPADQFLAHPAGSIWQVRFSPDGRLLATSCSDGTARVWQADRFHLMRSYPSPGTRESPFNVPHSDSVSGLAFSRDGMELMTSSAGGSVKLWDVATGELVWNFQVAAMDARYLPDGVRACIAGVDGVFSILDLRSHETLVQMDPTREPSVAGEFWWPSLDVSPDGKRIASAVSEETGVAEVTLWSPDTRVIETNFVAHSGRVFSVAFSPDGKLLATGGASDRLVRLWALPPLVTPEEATIQEWIKTLETGASPEREAAARDLFAAAPSAKQPLLQALREAHSIEVRRRLEHAVSAVERVEPGPVLEFDGHQTVVTQVAFSPNGRLIASGSGKGDWGEVLVWDIDHPERPVFHWSGANIGGLAFSPDGQMLAAGGRDGAVRVWSDAAFRVR